MSKFKSIVFAFLTTMAFFLDIERLWFNFDTMLRASGDINPFRSSIISVFVSFVLIYVFYRKKEENKISHWFNFLTILFSIFLVIGDSFIATSSFDLIFSSWGLFIYTVLKLIGIFVFVKRCITKLYMFLESDKLFDKNKKISKFMDNVLNKKPIRYSFLFLVICWLPYIISYYPIILSPDPSYQLMQYHGIKTKYMDYATPLDPNVTITNHHPFLHTLLIGGCSHVGKMIGNDNLGLFIYSIIQIFILGITLSYTIKYMKKMNIPDYIRVIALCIYAFVPMFPLYAMSGVKDTIYTALIILYVILIHNLIKFHIKDRVNIKKGFVIFLLLFAISVARNNGLYVILLSFPFIIFINKKSMITLTLCFIAFLGTYLSYNKVLLPYLKITPGSIREMLSIPFQQTARYVRDYPDQVTKEEKEIIDKVLVYDTLASRYKTYISDPVKNEFSSNTTKEDLNEYFKVWKKGLLKHPGTYIEATVGNVYGYFTPNSLNWYIYFKQDTRTVKANVLDYHYNGLKGPRDILSGYGCLFPYLPIIGLLANIGFNTWLTLYMTCHLIVRKEFKYLVILLPALISILICIASPVNTYFRYAMPYIFSNIIVFCLFISIISKKKEVLYER